MFLHNQSEWRGGGRVCLFAIVFSFIFTNVFTMFLVLCVSFGKCVASAVEGPVLLMILCRQILIYNCLYFAPRELWPLVCCSRHCCRLMNQSCSFILKMLAVNRE